jgi:hypothetical protein
MKSKNLSDLSVAELKKKEKTMKTVLGAFVGILAVFALMLTLLFIQKQYTIALPLLVVLFSSSTILFINKKELSNVRTELEKRSNNDMI